MKLTIFDKNLNESFMVMTETSDNDSLSPVTLEGNPLTLQKFREIYENSLRGGIFGGPVDLEGTVNNVDLLYALELMESEGYLIADSDFTPGPLDIPGFGSVEYDY